MDVIHFAYSSHTACGEFIVGSQSQQIISDEKISLITISSKNVQHTTLPESVTCGICKQSIEYKKALKEGEAEAD